MRYQDTTTKSSTIHYLGHKYRYHCMCLHNLHWNYNMQSCTIRPHTANWTTISRNTCISWQSCSGGGSHGRIRRSNTSGRNGGRGNNTTSGLHKSMDLHTNPDERRSRNCQHMMENTCYSNSRPESYNPRILRSPQCIRLVCIHKHRSYKSQYKLFSRCNSSQMGVWHWTSRIR